jgi:hypothetical protein
MRAADASNAVDAAITVPTFLVVFAKCTIAALGEIFAVYAVATLLAIVAFRTLPAEQAIEAKLTFTATIGTTAGHAFRQIFRVPATVTANRGKTGVAICTIFAFLTIDVGILICIFRIILHVQFLSPPIPCSADTHFSKLTTAFCKFFL